MIKGFACYEPKQSLRDHSYDPSNLKDNEVEVAISHCGICHSDIHLIDNDWGRSRYPFIPGHEIIGTVQAKGSGVRGLEIGQRVGIGWQSDSCGYCEWCISGRENLCAKQSATCIGRNGGYAEAIRVDYRFAISIPDGMDAAGAAPLLCGGVTVYSPLLDHGIRAQHKVGVIGIGGLGHLALQFAAQMGCEVTAISSTAGKEAEARAFGASHFLLSSDASAMRQAAGSLDFIISAVSGNLEFGKLLPLLRPKGKICIVGASSNALNIPAAALIGNRLTICASNIGSPSEIRSMLEFAARTGVKAKTEALPLAEVNAALDKVRANAARYRMVLSA
jgi:uncharacterized zinc-type alcohol dehydrogenase-like protein